jgi:hypothetical protein
MPVVTDPAFLLMYGLDESGLTAVRVNSGSLGDDQDLTVYQSTGSDGIVPVPDGRGGKAAWFDVVYPSPYASMAGAQRALRGPVSLGSAHLAKPTLPIASATHDFAFGVRFKWIGGETNGPAVNEGQFLFGLEQQQ